MDCWSLLDIPGEGGGEAAALWLEHGRTVPVHAATFDNEASRRLVLDYKHGRRIALARLLARLIAARLSGSAHDGAVPLLVLPPLHRWLLWQRGFNQAALLAGELARLGKGEAVVDGLIRRKRTPRLGELGREACERGLAGAIVVNRHRLMRIAGRDEVLVDDVFTSGATARACVSALAGARARSIAVACFARVVEAAGHGQRLQNETPEAL